VQGCKVNPYAAILRCHARFFGPGEPRFSSLGESACSLRSGFALPLHNRYMRADRHTVVKIDDILVEQADAAAGNGLADGLRLGGPM
jgi:hypothetical protein